MGESKAGFFSFLKNNIIYLSLAVLVLHCCMGFPLVAEIRGYSLLLVCGLLIAVAFLVVEQGSRTQGQ